MPQVGPTDESGGSRHSALLKKRAHSPLARVCGRDGAGFTSNHRVLGGLTKSSKSSRDDRTAPITVFVATDHRVRRPPTEALGIPFKVISLRPHKVFGVVRDWLMRSRWWRLMNKKLVSIFLNIYRGIGEITKALAATWQELDESKLREYPARDGEPGYLF